jgi:hypothetical protein
MTITLTGSDARQLDGVDASELARCEGVIERGINTFIDVGVALLRIRNGRLYRSSHDTFESYCRDRWGWSKTHVNRQIEAADVAGNLTPIGVKATHESQLRPLAILSPEDQRKVWAQAVEESNGQQPTAMKVEEVKQVFHERSIERRREAGITEPTRARNGYDSSPMSRKMYREMRKRMRINGKRNSRVWSFIEAMEVFSKPALPIAEAATEILAMNGPDVDWASQAEDALRNLALLVKELHQ